MDFSLFYFADDSGAAATNRYELLLAGARFADTHDFTAVWTPERHFHPFGGLYPNPSVTSAAIAVATERVAIRAGSVVAPLHHPLRIAEEWSVVDNLSGGRVGISFASGWHADDFALMPDAYEGRQQATVDLLTQVRDLWRGKAMSVRNGVGDPLDVRIHPQPVQPDLPTWVTTAGSPETFQAAGRVGAGILTHLWLQDVDQLAAKIDAYRQALRERPDDDGWPGHVVVMLHCALGADTDEVRELVREPMLDWLRSSFNLVAATARNHLGGYDPTKAKPEHREFLIKRSFDRYFPGTGLFGSVDTAREMVERLRAIGVDEVAGLIDFGLTVPQTLTSLEYVDVLRRECQDT
ncbi:MAG: MupA/Atu3671 family FMN-dependent luciferase-like monooxygenase [Actinocatenispora sp.]